MAGITDDGDRGTAKSRAVVTRTQVAVNDVHSRMNSTRVHRIVQPESVEAVRTAILDAQREGRAVSVAGGAGTRWEDSSSARVPFWSTRAR